MAPVPPPPLTLTAYDLAQRFIGVKETPGIADTPLIKAMLTLDQSWPESDEVPWCSAYVNFVCWLLRLPRSKSLRARSWLGVGRPIELEEATPGFDIVILNRANGPRDPNLAGPGHVGFFAQFPTNPHGSDSTYVYLLGGNQADTVSVQQYLAWDVLGVRRLYG